MSKVEQKKSRRERRSEERAASNDNDQLNNGKKENIDEETLHIKQLFEEKNIKNKKELALRLIYDRKNLKESLTVLLKQFLDKTNTDNRLEINLQYSQLCNLFKPEELDELELQRRLDSKDRPLDNILFRPSYRNRRKTSRYLLDGEEEFGSTWNNEDINQLLIGLWNDEPVPTISINIYYLSEYGLATVWDGDSKTRAIHAFLNDLPVIQVYSESKNTIGKMSSFISKILSREIVKSKNTLIYDAIHDFDYQRRAGDHKLDHITRTWLEQNNFGDLVKVIEETIPNYRVDNMSPKTEAEVYSKEGECGKPQTPIMLTMSKLSDDILPMVYKDKNGVDIHTKHGAETIVGNSDYHKPMKTSGNIFKETFGVRLPLPPIPGDKEYGMVDEFVFPFLVAAGFTINNIDDENPFSYDTKDIYSDSTVLRAFVRRLDDPKSEAVDIVNKWHRSFQYFCEKHSEHNPKLVDDLKNIIIDRWRTVEVLLGYCSTTKLKEDGCGVLNKKVQQLLHAYMKGKSANASGHLKQLRDYARRVNGISPEITATHFQAITKFNIAELITLLMNWSVNYRCANKSKLKNPNNVTEVFEIILRKFFSENDGWVAYVYSDGHYKGDNLFKAHDFVKTFGWPQKEIKEITTNGRGSGVSSTAQKNNYVSADISFPCSFGEFVLKNGGSLEKVAILANKFYEEQVIPELDAQFSDCASNARLRALMSRKLADDDYPTPENDYVIISGKRVKVSELEIGHIVPDSVGGLLYAKKNKLGEHIPLYVPETRQSNTTNSTDTRDLVGWFLSEKKSFSEWCEQSENDLNKKIGEYTINNGTKGLPKFVLAQTSQMTRDQVLTEKLHSLVEEALHLHKQEVEAMGNDMSRLDNN